MLSDLPKIMELESEDLNPRLSNFKGQEFPQIQAFKIGFSEYYMKLLPPLTTRSILICLKENVTLLNNWE